MRTLLLTLSLVVGLSLIPVADAGSAVAAIAASAAEAAQMPQINVDIHEGGGRTWNPMWIAIGVIGLLLVAVLFKMSNRGGGK